MSLTKRGRIWYVRFTAPDGTRVFRSARTAVRREAEEFEAQLRTRLWREAQLGESQALWQDAVVSWLNATTHRDRSGVQEKLRWLHPHLHDVPLRSITGDTLHRIRDTKVSEGVKPGTVNRYLAVVSAVLRHALDRGWIAGVPKIPRMKEPRGNLRFLSRDEARRLIAALRSRPRCKHLVDMVEFTLATGLREANVTGLRWAWVDMDARRAFIPASKSKSGRPIVVPLGDLAMSVLERRQGIHETHVFSYRGRPVRKAGRDGFQAAVRECGWDDVSWHTLRHTWASWHAMAGTPLRVLMELGGWTSMQMVLRYAHLAPDHLHEFAGNAVQGWCSEDSEKEENGAGY